MWILVDIRLCPWKVIWGWGISFGYVTGTKCYDEIPVSRTRKQSMALMYKFVDDFWTTKLFH